LLDRLHSLIPRLSSRRSIPLQPLQSEFVRITLELFDFLRTEWGYRSEVTGAGSFEITVLFKAKNVGVEIMLADEGWIIPKIIPLRNGKMPAWFDSSLRDLYTGFPLEDFFEFIDPTWKRPEHRRIESPEDIDDELRGYAEQLRKHGQPLLRGDRAVFDRMEDQMRHGLIVIYLKNWTRFVERVRSGFDGPFTEYIAGIIERSQLESVLKIWKGNRANDPVQEIQRIDNIFDDCTEPLRWGAGRNIMLPSPNARRWWRRPKWLTGSLREYFLVHGQTKT